MNPCGSKETTETLQNSAVETDKPEERRPSEKANEPQNMLKQIRKLEDEISSLHQHLASKDEQLSEARAAIQQFRGEGNSQEEVMALREEVNKLLQVQVCIFF